MFVYNVLYNCTSILLVNRGGLEREMKLMKMAPLVGISVEEEAKGC